MATLRALMSPSYAMERVKHYGVARLIIDNLKSAPALMPPAFKAIKAAKIAADPFGYSKRTRLAAEMMRTSEWKDFFSPKTGYLAAPPGTFKDIDDIIPKARELYASFLRMYPSGAMNDTSFSYILYDHSKSKEQHGVEDLAANPAFQDIACSRPLVEIASCYLGEVPIVGSVRLQVVKPNPDTEGFQKFHIDGAGIAPKQLKIFIAIEDVDEGNGATMIVPADISREISQSIGHRFGRISDEVVFSERFKSHVQHAAGSAGTAFLFDTCRSVHAGARARTRPRVLLMLQYNTKYGAAETLLERGRIKFDRERASRDELSRLLFNLE